MCPVHTPSSKTQLDSYFVKKRVFSFKSMSHLHLPLCSETQLQCITYVVTSEETLSPKASSASGSPDTVVLDITPHSSVTGHISFPPSRSIPSQVFQRRLSVIQNIQPRPPSNCPEMTSPSAIAAIPLKEGSPWKPGPDLNSLGPFQRTVNLVLMCPGEMKEDWVIAEAV